MERYLTIPFFQVVCFSFILLLNLHCGKEFSSQNDFALPPPYTGSNDRFAVQRAATATGPQVVFLNFDGATLSPSSTYGDDAQNNRTFLVHSTIQYPAFDASPYGIDRNTAISQIESDLAQIFGGYSLVFTAIRPSSGSYTMMMVGGDPSLLNLSSMVAGYSPVDASNSNPDDIGLVFAERVSQSTQSLQELSYVIAHETAHTFGLVHITPTNDIMYPSLGSGALIWGVGPETDNTSTVQDDKVALSEALEPVSSAPAPPPVPNPGNGGQSGSVVKPEAITNLSANVRGPQQVVLTWSPGRNAVIYDVWMRWTGFNSVNSTFGSWVKVSGNGLDPSSTSFQLSTLGPNQKYEAFVVSVRPAEGLTEASNIISFITPGPSPVFVAAQVSSNTFDLNWQPTPYAQSQAVEVRWKFSSASDDTYISWRQLGPMLDANAHSLHWGPVGGGLTFQVFIEATGYGISVPSNVITFAVP